MPALMGGAFGGTNSFHMLQPLHLFTIDCKSFLLLYMLQVRFLILLVGSARPLS